MFLEILKLVISLSIILAACDIFTNGIEWLGRKLYLGDGVVGSIFAAVGTCLPETLIPIMAIISTAKGAAENNVDIGIGAIIGAPFMLSTLAFFITGMSVIVFRRKRGTGLYLQTDNRILCRDLKHFIIMYVIGIASSLMPSKSARYIVAAFLIGYYIYYTIETIRNDKGIFYKPDHLYAAVLLKTGMPLTLVLAQVLVALGGIIIGARVFVSGIESAAGLLGISALALSLVITPIATELPEKFNSIIWISKRKDTLALGNITGAMVFQSCIPVAFGIVATNWELDEKALASALMALLSSTLVYIWIRIKGRLNPLPLLTGGIFYAIFIWYMITNGFQ